MERAKRAWPERPNEGKHERQALPGRTRRLARAQRTALTHRLGRWGVKRSDGHSPAILRAGLTEITVSPYGVWCGGFPSRVDCAPAGRVAKLVTRFVSARPTALEPHFGRTGKAGTITELVEWTRAASVG